MKFNNPYDYNGLLPVVKYPPSQCVPSLSMSIAEILRAYAEGRPIPRDIIGQPNYNLGNLSPLSRKGVDLADWSSLMKEARDAQKSANERLAELKRFQERLKEASESSKQQQQQQPAAGSSEGTK